MTKIIKLAAKIETTLNEFYEHTLEEDKIVVKPKSINNNFEITINAKNGFTRSFSIEKDVYEDEEKLNNIDTWLDSIEAHIIQYFKDEYYLKGDKLNEI